MADVHTPEIRSFNMSQIKGKNTKPEILVRKFLFSQGYRYRLHDRRLPGKPDIVLPKHKAIVFVHGCFWHGHTNCKYFVVPKTRTDWWMNKISRNKVVDKENKKKLTALGWRVIEVFECELKTQQQEKTLKRILNFI